MVRPAAAVLLLTAVISLASARSRPPGPPSDAPEVGAPARVAELKGAAPAVLYDRLCLACHGARGDGKGPAARFLWPRPRDFTRGEFKWRSTKSGSPPADEDLARTIRYGAPGTSMHAFGMTLGDPDVRGLVALIKGYAPKRFARPSTPADLTPEPPAGDPAHGRAVYEKLGCASCHGARGAGDGPAAKNLVEADGRKNPPFDLARAPLRRPRAPEESARAGIYATLVTGLSGTAMPSYEGSATTAELWAVASYVDSIRMRGALSLRVATAVAPPLREPTERDAGPEEVEHEIFGRGIVPPQGAAPANLAPAQASLSAKQCARCHAVQEREWRDSLHASASSPGLLAQIAPHDGNSVNGGFVESCQKCHAPLSEQMPMLGPDFKPHDQFDPALREQGINCASCHVRKWQRLGPPMLPNSSLLKLPGYPLTELPIYERADFCMSCHQLEADSAVEGKPRLNTYREWLEGPYMARGIQCQHCHMPNREHTFKGVHDPDTFRQGIAVEARATRGAGGLVEVRAQVKNVGAGHFLPTTPTPAAWLSIELLDEEGETIRGGTVEKRIGWHIEFRGGSWREIADTRIPPGQVLELAQAWRKAGDAKQVRVKVRVAPDDFYEGFYESRLESKRLPARERALFEEALARTRASKYVAYQRNFAILEPR